MVKFTQCLILYLQLLRIHGQQSYLQGLETKTPSLHHKITNNKKLAKLIL